MNTPLKLPDGYILKNSCKPIHGFKYNHPFDGHGLVNRIKIQDNTFTYKGIRVKTDHYKLEKAEKKMIFRGLNTNVDRIHVGSLFIQNFSNISVFCHNDEIQTMSEGGIPYIIDVESGETIGRKFKAIPPLVPFFPISAHPKVDNGKAVNVSCLMNGLILFDDDGIIATEIFPDLKQYYFHDFHITDKYYIFYLNRVSMDIASMYGKATVLEGTHLQKGNKVLLIDRETKERSYFDLPEYYDHNALHIATAKETRSGVTMYLSFIPDNFDMAALDSPHDFTGCYFHKVILDTKSKEVTCTKLSNVSGEMPVCTGDKVFIINTHTLSMFDTVKDIHYTKNFGNRIIEEPVAHGNTLFVISHSGHDTIIHVLEAETMEEIHTKRFPFIIPHGFHGTFLPISVPKLL